MNILSTSILLTALILIIIYHVFRDYSLEFKDQFKGIVYIFISVMSTLIFYKNSQSKITGGDEKNDVFAELEDSKEYNNNHYLTVPIIHNDLVLDDIGPIFSTDNNP